MHFLIENTLLYSITYLDKSQHTNFHLQIHILFQLKELQGYPDEDVAGARDEVAPPSVTKFNTHTAGNQKQGWTFDTFLRGISQHVAMLLASLQVPSVEAF